MSCFPKNLDVKKKILPIIATVVLLVSLSCASMRSPQDESEETAEGLGLPLLEAIGLLAERLATGLPSGTRMAVVAFESESDRLSDFIMDELAAALIGHGIEVADRQNLELVSRELDFQMTGAVSDETAMSVGRFLGAEVVITGQFLNLGTVHRLSANVTHVETATRISAPRFDVLNNMALQNMITALGGRPTPTTPPTVAATPPATTSPAIASGPRESVPVAGIGSSVSAADSHTVAIFGGTLWAWGSNGNGRLGDGTTTNPSAPVRIGGAANWVSVSAGERHTVAIREDGTLWAWGNNQFGRTGLGTTSGNTTSPVQIGTATNWIHASAGAEHTVAIRGDGTLWAWGRNDRGQLGDGSTANRQTPVQIQPGTTWAYGSAGGGHSVAIRADGSLWAWGLNSTGQLGDGTTANRNAPVQIQPGTTWVSVSAGGVVRGQRLVEDRHTVALRTDGSLWAWGSNSLGRLGDGTTNQSLIPIQIGTDTWQSVSAGSRHTMAIRSDGTLWAWGSNGRGQVGDGGGTSARNSPVLVHHSATWQSVSAGEEHTVAVRTDGTIWVWGRNNQRQLGDGTTNTRNSPTRLALR